jgi:hypothetical protein
VYATAAKPNRIVDVMTSSIVRRYVRNKTGDVAMRTGSSRVSYELISTFALQLGTSRANRTTAY